MQCPYAPIICNEPIDCVICDYYLSLFEYGIEGILIKLEDEEEI